MTKQECKTLVMDLGFIAKEDGNELAAMKNNCYAMSIWFDGTGHFNGDIYNFNGPSLKDDTIVYGDGHGKFIEGVSKKKLIQMLNDMCLQEKQLIKEARKQKIEEL